MKIKKHLPVWYKLFIKKRVKKLETALKILDIAEEYLDNGYLYLSIKYRNKAIQQAK